MIASAAASRQVQRLRLRAPDATLARRGVWLLEDALRTASLPDEGARMLVFRRLVLGRFSAGVSPQTLSLALERRVAQLRGQAVHATAPGSAQAAVVWFRGALEAHTLLALRIAADSPLPEWFWPLVVPEIERAGGTAQRLRVVLRSLGRLPEAPTALALLACALAQHGHADALQAAIGADEARALLQPDETDVSIARPQFGTIPVSFVASAPRQREPLAPAVDKPAEVLSPLAPRASLRAHVPPRAEAAAPSGSRPTDDVAPTRSLVQPTATSILQRRTRDAAGVAPGVAIDALVGKGVATQQRESRGNAAASAEPLCAPARSLAPRAAAQPSACVPSVPATHMSAAMQSSSAAPGDALDQPQWPVAASTQAGGLLFLLPVLVRLGYMRWLDEMPEWAPLRIDRRVFAVVCTRLALPPDDPAWRLCTAPAMPPPQRYCAPAIWIESVADCGSAWRRHVAAGGTRLYDASGRLLLAAWRGRRRPSAFAGLLRGREIVRSRDNHPDGDLTAAVAQAWLTACRRWLRRRARTGVASLVARPARLSLTPTHADMFFELSGVSLSVRRAGLDLDPGWVPWFGRVVTFHYGRTPWI